MNLLPVSRVIRASVSLTPAGAQSQTLRDMLVLGTSGIIDMTERYRSYSSLAGVATDFGTAAEEYLAARAWFGQSPQPTKIVLGRWAKTATKGGLRCAPLTTAQQALATWQAVVAGAFKIVKDGAAAVAVTGLDFSAAANMNAIAALIQAGVGMPVGVAVVWNATYSRFEFESATTGILSNIAFLQAPAAGTDISAMLGGLAINSGSYSYLGTALETADAAAAAFDDLIGQKWYGLYVPAATDADHSLLAAYIEASANKHVYGVTTQEAGVIVAATTTDIAYVLKAANLMRTFVQFSSSNAYAALSALARIMTTDYEGAGTVITLKFKNEPGVTAEALSTSQADAAAGKNANVFTSYDNDTNILQEGVMANGTFADVVMGTDWLATTMQRDLYNLLYSSATKIPQTDQGMQVLTTACEARCSQAVRNGLVAPGVWNSSGFGQLSQGDYLQKGYYVYAALMSTQASADRTARKAVPIQVAVKLAGAIHSADILISVNQ